MIVEIAHFLLYFIFFINVISIVASFCNKNFDVKYLKLNHSMNLLLSSFALIALGYAFYIDDFSLEYVARNSCTILPVQYKLTAIWGGHEGSLLLWLWCLHLWNFSLKFSSITDKNYLLRLHQAALLIAIAFLALLVFSSNPFLRLENPPINGADLNPLLQDISFILHPPLLYLGYVGMAVPFCHTIAQMLNNNIALNIWANAIRRPTLIAFAALSGGITLGSYWAYYELGWGGYWFWDPVENASLMPWLVATALLHAIMLAKKSLFANWTKILAIATFAFSIIGLFIVRSGIISSVHAFATDPIRGIAILCILALTLLISFSIFAIYYQKTTNISFHPLSRPSLLFCNSLILSVITACVFLGTIFPLVYEIITKDKLSVGYLYFNQVIIPIFVPLLALMIPGIYCKWGDNNYQQILKLILKFFFISLVLSGLPFLVTDKFSTPAFLWSLLPWVVIVATSSKIYNKFLAKNISRRTFYMPLSHLGIAITALGIIFNAYYHQEHDVSMKIGDAFNINNHKITFISSTIKTGKNYISHVANFSIEHNNNKKTLYPEKRVYLASETRISEVAISPSLWSEFYKALGEKEKANIWSVRLYFKPFVRLIWFGGLMLLAVGFLALITPNKRIIS